MTVTTPTVEEKTILQKAFHAGSQLATIGWEAGQIKEQVEHAVDDGIRAAKRAAKNGRHAAVDLLDETAYRIKHDPLRSVALGFGAGIGLGAMLGWLVTRNERNT
ncbi:MAG: hypothetical protein HOP19_16790 [Acidobacteria bacterium]|nr:hypothetical protein [Acidobacteriota bacterium]